MHLRSSAFFCSHDMLVSSKLLQEQSHFDAALRSVLLIGSDPTSFCAALDPLEKPFYCCCDASKSALLESNQTLAERTVKQLPNVWH